MNVLQLKHEKDGQYGSVRRYLPFTTIKNETSAGIQSKSLTRHKGQWPPSLGPSLSIQIHSAAMTRGN